MSEIALIYPYVYKHARNTMLFHPLGIAQLSALLRQDGIDTLVQDHTFKKVPDALKEIVESRPRVVGIYVMLTMIEDSLSLARQIRELIPGTLLVCGGPMPTLRPEQFAREFDIIFRGEAVYSFPLFCKDYLNSDTLAAVLKEYGRYPGLHAHDARSGELYTSPMQPTSEESLNNLPIPDRRDYDHTLYQSFWQEREGYAPAGIMTTYGCPHACDFCSKPVFGRYFRRRSVNRIMEEVHNIKSLGYNGLWIADDCFTLDLDHVRAFCRRMIDEDVQMEWTCLSRTEKISFEDIHLMRKAGCRKMFFGLESGSNAVLSLMNKQASVEASEHMIHAVSESGIQTAGFFMVGYPGETYETIEKTLHWALTLPLDEVSFTIPFPLPYTALFRKVYGLQPDADWGYENENRMVYKSEFDEAYLNKRIEETYAEFERKKSKQR
jgi:anaerobic magnesium-protoporphyrin IX monomethyl ester cyclase